MGRPCSHKGCLSRASHAQPGQDHHYRGCAQVIQTNWTKGRMSGCRCQPTPQAQNLSSTPTIEPGRSPHLHRRRLAAPIHRRFGPPAGLVTAPNGDAFVADEQRSNNRVVQYSKGGKFIKSWEDTGYEPGEFRSLVHCIAVDKRARMFVCGRSKLGSRSSTRKGNNWQHGISSECRGGCLLGQ